MALLMVLLLLALTMGLCYAAMRSQATVSMIQRNSDRRAYARQDAITGLTMAMKQMSLTGWGGVGTSLNGSLGTNDTFLVTYTSGDTTLSTTDPNQPFRVTLLSTGYSADPQQLQSIAIYRVRAVVRIIPRQVAAEPSNWSTMQKFTLYQTDTQTTNLDIPCQFTGPVQAEGQLNIAQDYPNNDSARSQYISDLNAMRLAGLSDYRPFNGPVNLPVNQQNAKYLGYLTPGLGITVNNTTAQKAASDWVMPTSLTTYQIYPGGLTYTVQAAPSTLGNQTLQPNATTNPLGLFFTSGNVTINSNVTVTGSLFCGGNITIAGTKVVLQAVALPSMAGTTGPVRLAAAACQNFTVNTAAGGQVTGPLAVFNNFQIQQGSETMAFSVAGQLVARQITIQQRTEWNQINWNNCYQQFLFAHMLSPLTVKYFPVWMNTNYGCNPASLLTFAPESPAATYHWASSYAPIFVSNASDGGLRWDLLSWTENV